jgi:2-methylaconitate cis-trans-isomerase PrpF
LGYLFALVMVKERLVDTTPNCGNMLCAVGPFAIEQGQVAATDPVIGFHGSSTFSIS